MKRLFTKKILTFVVMLTVCTASTYSYASTVWDDSGAKKIDNGMTLQPKSQNTKKTTEAKKDTSTKSADKKEETKKEQPKTISQNKNHKKSETQEAIEFAKQRGYAYIDKSGKFLPKKNIQRYEFIYMVNRAFGFKKTKKVNFVDVKKTDFYYNDVSITMGAGYLYTFKKNTVFGPKKYFYRWELPHILGKAMNMKLSEKSSKTLMKYSDGKKVPKSARGSVSYFIEKGWMKPKSKKNFGTHDILTKEEMAYVLYQLHKEGYIK